MSQIIDHVINVDFNKYTDRVLVVIQQYEKLSRRLLINLTCDNKTFVSDDSYTYKIQFDKKDGTSTIHTSKDTYNPIVIQDNPFQLQYLIDENDCACEGKICCKVSIVQNGNELRSTLFLLRVDGGMTAEKDIVSSSEYKRFEDFVDKVDEFDERITQNTSNVSDLQINMSNLKVTVAGNKSDIQSIKTELSNLGIESASKIYNAWCKTASEDDTKIVLNSNITPSVIDSGFTEGSIVAIYFDNKNTFKSDNNMPVYLNVINEEDQSIIKSYSIVSNHGGAYYYDIIEEYNFFYVDTNALIPIARDIFTGSTESENGIPGLVPAPKAGEQNYFLRGDGVWVTPTIVTNNLETRVESLEDSVEFINYEINNVEDRVIKIEAENLINKEITSKITDWVNGYIDSSGNLISDESSSNMTTDFISLPKDSIITINGYTGDWGLSIHSYDIDTKEYIGVVRSLSSSNTTYIATKDLLIRCTTDDPSITTQTIITTIINGRVDNLEEVTTNKINISDIIDNLTTNVSSKPLSAAQGVTIKSLIDALQSDVNNKANQSDLHTHSNKSVLDAITASYTVADKTKLDGIATGAEVNQNAFSNVVIGTTTIASDSKMDTLTLAGSNVTLTPDATNDKVTIGITKDNVVSALGYTPGTSSTEPITYELSKNNNEVVLTSSEGIISSVDMVNYTAGNSDKVNNHTVESDVPSDAIFTDTVYTHPSSGVEAGTYKKVTVDENGHVINGDNSVISISEGGTGATTASDALVNFGITASSEELNYVNGVTSNIQIQLNNKASAGHTHKYAGSYSVSGGAIKLYYEVIFKGTATSDISTTLTGSYCEGYNYVGISGAINGYKFTQLFPISTFYEYGDNAKGCCIAIANGLSSSTLTGMVRFNDHDHIIEVNNITLYEVVLFEDAFGTMQSF